MGVVVPFNPTLVCGGWRSVQGHPLLLCEVEASPTYTLSELLDTLVCLFGCFLDRVSLCTQSRLSWLSNLALRTRLA